MPYHFTQPCPTCGRHNRIAVELLGRQVCCPHCQAEFTGGADEGSASGSSLERPLLERVDDILRRSAEVAVAPVTATGFDRFFSEHRE